MSDVSVRVIRVGNAVEIDIDFDHVFEVTHTGETRDVANVHAPEVWHDYVHDMSIDWVPYRESDRWEALTGYTRQSGYRGPVLHASEYLGGGLARDIIAAPGVYVCVVVESDHDDDCGHDDDIRDIELCEPAGWAVLRLKESGE